MRKNQFLFKLLAPLLVLGLLAAACGGDDDSAGAAPPPAPEPPAAAPEPPPPAPEPPPPPTDDGGCAETYEVRYANLATFILYFRDLEAGLASFGAENCWNFSAADAAYVIEDQFAQIEDFATQGVDLIIASPGDREALVPAYEAAAAAGIPILSTGDSVRNPELEIGFIGTDWDVEGTKQSEWMVEQMGGSGKLARIGGPGASEYVEKRKEGFEAVMEANPGIEIVFNQSANSFTQEEGLRLAQDALTANPDLDGIWADSDALALGAAIAVDEAGIDHVDILISGTDGEPAVFDQVRDGTGVDMTIALRGYAWGTRTAEVAHAFLTSGSTGEDYFIQAPTIVVDATSIVGMSNDDLR